VLDRDKKLQEAVYGSLIVQCESMLGALGSMSSAEEFAASFTGTDAVSQENVLRELTQTEARLVFLLFSTAQACAKAIGAGESLGMVFAWLFGGMIGKTFAMLNGSVLMEFQNDERIKLPTVLPRIQLVNQALCFVATPVDAVNLAGKVFDLSDWQPEGCKIQ